MATSERHLCDICMTQHLTEHAIVHCPECEENFCEKCKIHHVVAKATKKHEIISIENVLKLPKFVQDIKMNCPEHDEKFVLYCDAHEVPCCTQCLDNAHAGCRNVTSFQKVIHNVKESPLLVDLETTLSDLMTNIKNIIEDRNANLQGLAEQKTRCKREIKTARGEINAYFDELETNLLDDLQKAFSEKEFEIQNMLEDFEMRKSNVCEMQEHVTIVKSIASEFQSFMAIQELIQTANTAETELQHLFESGFFNWIEIFYAQIDLNSVKHNLPSIGKTDVKVDVSRIELKVRKTLGAQLIGPAKSSENIESIQLKEKVKSKLPKGKYEFEILDCGFLLDGNLVFSDKKNERLVILDPNGLFVRSLYLCFHPIRFAVIDEEKIAITTTDHVNIVELKNGFTLRTLIPGTKARSIALTDDKHLMVENLHAGFTLIDLKGNIIRYIHVEFKSDTCYHFPVCIKERLYCVYSPRKMLYCYDFDGKQVSKFKNELFEGHLALTSDKSNMLFCSSWNSKNVFVISTDRKSSKKIIKSNMYLTQAVAADYNVNKKELLIVTTNGNFILYDVI